MLNKREAVIGLYHRLIRYMHDGHNLDEEGLSILEEFKNLLLNSDIMFGSKKITGDKLKFLKENVGYGTEYTTGIIMKKIVMNDSLQAELAATDEDMLLEYFKKDFVEALEGEWLND